MSNANEVKLSLKVMINKQKTKVLFAEADSYFTDVLLSFMTLPLGTIIRVLKKQYGDEALVFGSLTTLYNGLANLESCFFRTECGKQMLLNPRSLFESECRKLILNVDDTPPSKFFKCGDKNCKRKRSPYVSLYHETMKCDCGNFLDKAMGILESKRAEDDNSYDDGVFVDTEMSFLITDDLQMSPIVHGSIIETLIKLGVTVPSGAELRTMTLGLNEIIDLLRASLLSDTPLTDIFLNKRRRTNGVAGDFLHQMEEGSSSNSKKMMVKAFLQKSDNKLLFARAREDFVDFLFSLLVIPLGGVECLLGSNTSLKSMDNLYRSIKNAIDDYYLMMTTPVLEMRLIKPELPPSYLSRNLIFPLTEQITPTIYYLESVSAPDGTKEEGAWMRFKDPKGGPSYVQMGLSFMVTDDLTVTHIHSINSVLERLNIRLCDVKELELHVGLEEALNILKASLTSTSALTDGLINPILEKQPKQEH